MTATPSPFGTLLGYAPGEVAVYSSDYNSVSAGDYPSRSAFRSYLDGIYMGYKWQCVEFARRWMYLNKGYIFDDVAMAYDIFDLRSVRDVASNSRLPLHAFRNGSPAHPRPGSLLIWDEGGEFQHTGHVAVVTEVFPDRLRIAEQNVGHQIWPAGHNFSRELRARVGDEGDYWLECSFGNATILGWVTQTDDARHAEPGVDIDSRLFALQARRAVDNGQLHKPWLNMANEDEAAYVESMHGHRMSSVDSDLLRYYAMSNAAMGELEHATNDLHELFMHATDYVLENPALLERFNLPAAILPKIRQSWDNRLNQLITSRFDFAMTEHGLKVYEYNCDSASCFMECAKVQGKWAKHFDVNDGEDAGKDLFIDLVNAWKKSNADGLLHILRDDDAEEKYHALFMQQVLAAAGIPARIITGLDGLVWDAAGNILDAEGDTVKWVWKTWAWETALDQIRAESEADALAGKTYEPSWKAGEQPRLSDVLLRDKVMVFEPLWSLIPSNKAILPVLWSLFPNHPLLLNTDYALNEDLLASGYVSKPIVGRCGENIQMVDQQDAVLETTEGKFASQEQVYQQLFPLPLVDGYYVQVCTFTAAGNYAGSCVRVDPSMIIGKDSDLMPLRIYPDKEF